MHHTMSLPPASVLSEGSLNTSGGKIRHKPASVAQTKHQKIQPDLFSVVDDELGRTTETQASLHVDSVFSRK